MFTFMGDRKKETLDISIRAIMGAVSKQDKAVLKQLREYFTEIKGLNKIKC